jgi:aminopeptidase
MDIFTERMARVLARYSLDIKAGETVLVKGDIPSLPLLQAFAQEVLEIGAYLEPMVEPQFLREMLLKRGSDAQLSYSSPIQMKAAEAADAYLSIWSETNTKALSKVDPARMKVYAQAHADLSKMLYSRMGSGALRWCGTQYPTEAVAQEAGMSLLDFQDFVNSACLLKEEDPVAAWKKVGEQQERIRLILNQKKHLRFVSNETDLSVEVGGRNWVNCCGRMNLPDGEIFTGPVEDSVEGHIRFSFPGVYSGREVEDIRLWFEKGKVIRATAAKGEDLLHQLLDTDAGSRRVGEIAMGTNFGIKEFCRNMLFDEKIGGTIHLALGRSIPESLGVNESAIHWDMLCDMRQGGEIVADGEVIYRDGRFVI